ncbi:MAG TPA: amidohydrolase family protein [Gammaproteobacteria bacterium]|nr:amidohydrolase family protein [Gammaproteobacteria bacterium]
MIGRRAFLGAAGLAAAGVMLAGRPLSAIAQGRKEVRVGGRRVRVVDIHAHCAFQEVAPIIAGTPLAKADLGDNLLIGPRRIAEMDARGIDIAALSVNRYWWYEATREQARAIVRINDEELAKWCAAHPNRFVALSSPALQFPDLAAEQVEYAVTQLGHRGVSIGGHAQNEIPSSEKFDPFWAKVEELGVPVFMHPNNAENLIVSGRLAGPGGLNNVVGNPLETTVFLSRLIFDGTLDRFPDVRVCGAHGGGYLPSYLGRSEVACGRNNSNCRNARSPGEYLRTQILADSMVFSEEGLRHLVAEMGVGQLVYGSDMPFDWPDTIDIIVASPSLSDADKIAILGGTLVELLKIDT